MRAWLSILLAFVAAFPARGEEAALAKYLKASIVFHDDFDATRHYPHVLKVFLRLEKVHDADVSWIANGCHGCEARIARNVSR